MGANIDLCRGASLGSPYGMGFDWDGSGPFLNEAANGRRQE